MNPYIHVFTGLSTHGFTDQNIRRTKGMLCMLKYETNLLLVKPTDLVTQIYVNVNVMLNFSHGYFVSNYCTIPFQAFFSSQVIVSQSQI